jgi:hypothetical protein
MTENVWSVDPPKGTKWMSGDSRLAWLLARFGWKRLHNRLWDDYGWLVVECEKNGRRLYRLARRQPA